MVLLPLTPCEAEALHRHFLRQRITSDRCDSPELTEVWLKLLDIIDDNARRRYVTERFSWLGEISDDDLRKGGHP
jgi:hypothetical protein